MTIGIKSRRRKRTMFYSNVKSGSLARAITIRSPSGARESTFVIRKMVRKKRVSKLHAKRGMILAANRAEAMAKSPRSRISPKERAEMLAVAKVYRKEASSDFYR